MCDADSVVNVIICAELLQLYSLFSSKTLCSVRGQYGSNNKYHACLCFLTQRTCLRFSKQRKPENCCNIRKFIRILVFRKEDRPCPTVLISPYTALSLYLGAAQSQLALEVVSVNASIKQQPLQASSLKPDYFSAPPPHHFHGKYTTPCTALQFL